MFAPWLQKIACDLACQPKYGAVVRFDVNASACLKCIDQEDAQDNE